MKAIRRNLDVVFIVATVATLVGIVIYNIVVHGIR